MTRDEFMKMARGTAHQILEGKENGIMNLVQRAWAEGKRNAEVETLRAAIDEALDRRESKVEPAEDAVYPTWAEWLMEHGLIYGSNSAYMEHWFVINQSGVEKPIPADIAEKLGIEPKEAE